jgi:polyhydroxybutyrate depolymerase
MGTKRGKLSTSLALMMVIGMAACSLAPATPTATSTASPAAVESSATSAETIAPTSSSSLAPAGPTPTATAASTPAGSSSDLTRTVTVNGVQREYILHIPPGLDLSLAVPVVVVFHDYGTAPAEMPAETGFNAVADKNGFLVVYPKGTGSSENQRAWNTGICCGEALAENVDDPAFVQVLLKDLGSVARLDSKRIYAVGSSNGGVLTYQLACKMSDTFAAVAPVAAQLLQQDTCQPQQPVAVLHVHGSSDETIGISQAQRSIQTWAQLDGCTSPPQQDQPAAKLEHTVYASCRAGTAVELYTVSKGGHNWPSDLYLPASQSWSGVIWAFFAAHPKP